MLILFTVVFKNVLLIMNQLQRENVATVNKVQTTEIKENKPTEEELSLSGATTLPEIRQLLMEWFSSTETPEEEDSQAVSTYLIGLVNKRELDKVEPVLRLLKRYCYLFYSLIVDFADHTQLQILIFFVIWSLKLYRWSSDKNDNWKRVINEIINTTQLYVIQYYNAPLKLPSSA